MKSLILIFLPILVASAAAIHADEFKGVANDSTSSGSGGLTSFLQAQHASGHVRTNYFHSSKRLDNDIHFLGVTAQIKVLPELTGTIDGKLEARLTNPAPGDGDNTQSRLLEGYATIHFAKADLRVGKQVVAWGRADGINPTDNLTPRDYVVLLPFENDQRFGTTAVKLDAFLSQEYTVTVFATPFFEPSKIPLSATGLIFTKTTPTRILSNTEVGLKLNKVGEGFDWSISYFRGFSLLPDAQLIRSGPAEPMLELHYDRITVFGADFARNYGRFGLRGEMAYVDTADDAGTNLGVKNPSLFWIVGVDRTFLDNLNINLQFFQRWVRHHQNPETIADPIERSIVIRNAILDGQRDRLNNGISFRVSNKWLNDTLEAEVFAVVNFTHVNSFLRPLVTYTFNDHWKGTIGGEYYRGAQDTSYGSLKSNRGIFAELKYGF